MIPMPNLLLVCHWMLVLTKLEVCDIIVVGVEEEFDIFLILDYNRDVSEVEIYSDEREMRF